MSFNFSNLQLKGNTLSFDVTDAELSIVNSLRRIVLSEIPTIAFAFDPLTDTNPDIKINVNKSALHNEFIGHRLSLLPICFNKDEISEFNPDDYKFVLKVKNTSDDIIRVTTKDIKIYNAKGELYSQQVHEQLFPRNPLSKDYILITRLRPNIYRPENGEELNIEMRASRNIAKAHARWSPVSCCTFFNHVDDDVYKQKLTEKYESFTLPLNDTEKEYVKKRFNTIDKYRCFKMNKYGEANAFHFKIESECGLKPQDVFHMALGILLQKLNKFNDRIKDMDGITVKTLHEDQHFIEMIIDNEDYTLINLLQSCIYNHEIRNTSQQLKKLEYIGYYQPHPLDTKMIMKIKTNEALNLSEFFDKNINLICEEIEKISAAWSKLWID
jgi:DNA-directed RNA polymerase II subunit RPB3